MLVPVPGSMETVSLVATAGLVPRAVMLTESPEAMAVARVRMTILGVAPMVALDTLSAVAAPPEGV